MSRYRDDIEDERALVLAPVSRWTPEKKFLLMRAVQNGRITLLEAREAHAVSPRSSTTGGGCSAVAGSRPCGRSSSGEPELGAGSGKPCTRVIYGDTDRLAAALRVARERVREGQAA